MRCFSVTQPRSFPEHSQNPQTAVPVLITTAAMFFFFLFPLCFCFSKGAKTSAVWLLCPSVFTGSLTTMSDGGKKKEKKATFHFVRISILFWRGLLFVLPVYPCPKSSSVPPGLRIVCCLFRWPGWTRLRSRSRASSSLCMIRISACTAYLSVCLSVPCHISAQEIEH